MKLFTTCGLPARERRAAWDEVVAKVCGPFIAEYGPDDTVLDAEMDVRSLGGLHCAMIAQNTLSVRRSRVEVGRADDRLCFVVMQLRGRSRMVQMNREACLAPGDMTLIDSGRPCAFHFDRDNAQFSLHIPRGLIERHLRAGRLPLAEPMRGGLAAAAGAMIRSLFETGGTLSARHGAVAREALTSMILSMLLDDDVADGPAVPAHADAQVAAIRAYIELHVDAPGLSAASIARAHRMSVRHLHRLFQATGTTVGDCIRGLRLEKCASDLRNPGMRGATVTEIAYRWGFSDAAHFSRSFRAAFGQAPREYRATLRM
ncbi:transcriptional regulator FeaR [Arenibaculum pallidiluteum]|uniref:transcriptional regulator FeaR n=1 Tax=Arenibaculum pallidiluteum TaxID=2812559 RepID=UPI001A970E06|nr:transcriptional regulator FeaR [Arenibaculum pallidiluteum]